MQDTIKLLAQTLKLEEVLQYLCIRMSYTYYICVQITQYMCMHNVLYPFPPMLAN